MLANIDLLIAIWDGAEAAGVGDTAQIVGRAIADGIPVIRIDPRIPDAMQISWSQPGDLPPAHAYAQPTHTFRPGDEATVALVIGEILALPDEARVSLPQYLLERERSWNFCPWYPLLLWVFGGQRSVRESRLFRPIPIHAILATWFYGGESAFRRVRPTPSGFSACWRSLSPSKPRPLICRSHRRPRHSVAEAV